MPWRGLCPRLPSEDTSSGAGSRQDSSAANERAIVGKSGQNTPDQQPSELPKTSTTTSSSMPDIEEAFNCGFLGGLLKKDYINYKKMFCYEKQLVSIWVYPGGTRTTQ